MNAACDSHDLPVTEGPCLLPVGIFMGRLPDPGGPSSAEGSCFLLRRAGQFYVLTEMERLIFSYAHSCVPKGELLLRLSRHHPEFRKGNRLTEALHTLCASLVIVELSGSQASDRQLLEPLIVIPRARSFGYMNGSDGVFSLLTPDKAGLLTFDGDLQLFWARADGHTTVGTAIKEASNDSGKTASYLWKRCCAFIRLLPATGAAFIDTAQGGNA